MPLLPEQVPEHDREPVGLVGEDRDAGAGEALRKHLQRDGLAGTGRPGDQSVAVGKRKRQNFRLETLPDEDRAVFVEVRHGTIPSRQLVAIVALPCVRSTGRGCDRSKRKLATTRACTFTEIVALYRLITTFSSRRARECASSEQTMDAR